MLKDRLKKFEDNASWLKDGVLYHRGKHDSEIRENTLKAMEGAIKDKLGVELDVRLTKDNFVVVAHDDSLKRIYGVDYKISELTYDEVCNYTNNEIPLFSHVLKEIDGNIGVMVEIKPDRVKELVNRTYDILKEYKGKFVIVSFSPIALKLIRKKDKDIIRGQLSYSYKNSKFNGFVKFCLSHMFFNFISKPHFISYGIENCNFKVLKKMKRKGYFIIGWTYRSEENKEQLIEFYDNMIVENIELREFK